MKSENSFEKIVPKINIICTNSVGVTNFSPKSADSSAIFRPGKSDLITEEARHWCRWMDGRYWLTSGWWLSCLSRAAGIDRRTNRHRRWRRQKFNKIHEINFNLINRDWVNWLRVEPSRVVFKERERERLRGGSNRDTLESVWVEATPEKFNYTGFVLCSPNWRMFHKLFINQGNWFSFLAIGRLN